MKYDFNIAKKVFYHYLQLYINKKQKCKVSWGESRENKKLKAFSCQVSAFKKYTAPFGRGVFFTPSAIVMLEVFVFYGRQYLEVLRCLLLL